MERYNHRAIEAKWQKRWSENGIYKTRENASRKKCYVLDMFPYPSGEGLHVGHLKGYIATDIYSRYKRMNDFNVLHPMGWDAFGLPAENYALKHKVHPRVSVEKNIVHYKEQLSIIGFDYDWSREINTTDPEYYRWTQWIFLQLFKKGLAYESNEPINWCPSCMTGLANEDLDGDRCERCGTKIEKKRLRQWVLRITDYADRMLDDLASLPWPESVKEAERNWIGRSEGTVIRFAIADSPHSIDVFTTRADTLFGATYLVLSPEHDLIAKINNQNGKSQIKIENMKAVADYVQDSLLKTEIDRTAAGKEKTGVELKGIKAVNPANGEEIPIFVADYVIVNYGTGAIMAVPAHDERDFQFAKKYGLPMKMVVCPHYPAPTCPVLDEAYLGEGHLVDSVMFNGLHSSEARKRIGSKYGTSQVVYKLKDWVFSRQRYWGEPIPLVHCEKCGVVAVPESELPVKLPDVERYEPSGTGESPLANMHDWVNVKCPKCGGPAKRETNTMPQWAGSCWYHIAYAVKDTSVSTISYKLNAKSSPDYWLPVDLYVGGAEHATRHLIYARFWHKFLYDIGVVRAKEPFTRLVNVGLIMGPDGRKMSKRLGNVINPDEIVHTFGADTLRIYEMFLGPFEQSSAWSTESVIGARRFIERIVKMSEKVSDVEASKAISSSLHRTISKVSGDIESLRLNTAISAMMIFVNDATRLDALPKIIFLDFLRLLAPFAPHVSEELWEHFGEKGSIHESEWPVADQSLMNEETITLAVQVDGKLRDSLEVLSGISEEEAVGRARSSDRVSKWLDGRAIQKTIFVRGRLLNFVTRSG